MQLYHKLEESNKKLGADEELPKLPDANNDMPVSTSDEKLLAEQLQFIYSVSKDIDKISNQLILETT